MLFMFSSVHDPLIFTNRIKFQFFASETKGFQVYDSTRFLSEQAKPRKKFIGRYLDTKELIFCE